MQMEYRFSLTPRLVAIGLFSLLALFVLLFLLGMQVGQRTRPLTEVVPVPSAAEKAVAGAEKQATDTESALKTKVEAPAAALAPAEKH